ncbi:hypothetical protein [Paenibacillus sp. GCM10028914]|uniref:hypothetical protein n=1 Tax=Paenibacillus sp. GCM10028914 TaxID=3273416 RepID=UPI00360C450C
MSKVKVKSISNDRRPSTSKLKVISFYTALLVVITALLGLYIAWVELMTQGNTEELIV